ncbi:MAG: UDP-N-acetylglucosamine--N-acetylmuramyl-(pentapeptide) pyrophosphoryl-undecaprenol N-acetylglucosamine transferase [Planctomycetota bacterium]|jgi:UDP-N-acetylglucosamine--N-acetylmuramyl-(pentapeptide) pyrophosphoryl-undecaprenol N-acetylglucosamine transferase
MQTSKDRPPTVLFAGGGTGGHIYPALAVAERLTDYGVEIGIHFAVSDRPIDRDIMQQAGESFTALSVRPLPRRPWHVPGFLTRYLRSKNAARDLIQSQNVVAVVSLGGFVSGPVVAAARSMDVPTVLVNLDAVPGKANRFLAHKCDRVVTVYESDALPEASELIGMPLRRKALGPDGTDGQREARQKLGLDPEKQTLVITGASQGATSINQMLIELADRGLFDRLLADWQVLHLSGAGQATKLCEAYRPLGDRATVLEFSHEMGLVWSSASLALSRAGAGSVAEVLANTVPTVFFPYPYHKDQHQKLNAQTLVEAGAALMQDDAIDAKANADALVRTLSGLLEDRNGLETMRARLNELQRGDGASHVAQMTLKLASIIE